METETPTPDGVNLPVLSVSEISLSLKRSVEDAFSRVRVRGEITGFKRAASGHLYFSLKDEGAVLDGVCWRGTRLGMEPDDGMEVIATGRLSTYAPRSRYQMVVESMELAGEGALLKLLEARKKKLAAEGLFDQERKRPIPFLPEVIGVVTSPTGAVIRDILHRLGERFPRRVLLWPVLVQGTDAADQVARAIEGFNRLPPTAAADAPVRPDVLIVARGGGSLEDLWAFNEERVVRAARASEIPLISAVGHETDTTLIDLAADVRAPTPSAAAEMAVPVRIELLARVHDDGWRMLGAMTRLIDDGHIRLSGLARGLPDLARLTEGAAQRLDDWCERLTNGLRVGLDRRRAELARLAAMLPDLRQDIRHRADRLDGLVRSLVPAVGGILRDRRARLGQAGALLESASYQRVLERGFALVGDASGRPLRSIGAVAVGMDLSVHFHDGDAGATVNRVSGSGGRPARRAPRKKTAKPTPGDDGQGSLL